MARERLFAHGKDACWMRDAKLVHVLSGGSGLVSGDDSMDWTLKSSGITGALALIASMNGLITAVIQLTTLLFCRMYAFVLPLTGNLLSKALVAVELGCPVFHEQTLSLTIYLVVT